MVSNLVRKSRDPNGKGRGAGMYYHRGNGVWSKYTPAMDAVEWHRRKKVANRKKAMVLSPHKADYKTKSKRSKAKVKGPTGRRGYF